MRRKQGFTFIEIMVTIMILATGIVMIYKTFLTSLDQQTYLLHRLYANNLLDQRIAELQHLFEEQGKTSLEKKGTIIEEVSIHNKIVPFEVQAFFTDVLDLEDILQLDIGIFWSEHGRPVRLTRSIYISRY